MVGPVEIVALSVFALLGIAVLCVAHRRLPRLAILFAVTMALNALGWVFEYYGDVPGFDELAHGLTTTALTGLVGYICFRRLLPLPGVSLGHLAIAILSLGIAIGAVWEVIEWFTYLLTGRPGIIKSLNDTVSDLTWDILGAALALPLLWADVLRESRRGASPRRTLFGWPAFVALAVGIGSLWSVAENRGDDAIEVESRRQIIEAHRRGKEVTGKGREGAEDLYTAIKESPDDYEGKTLIVRKTVSAITGPNQIRIDADGMIGTRELVVQLRKNELPEKLAIGDQIELLGTAEVAADGEPVFLAEAVLDYAGDE